MPLIDWVASFLATSQSCGNCGWCSGGAHVGDDGESYDGYCVWEPAIRLQAALWDSSVEHPPGDVLYSEWCSAWQLATGGPSPWRAKLALSAGAPSVVQYSLFVIDSAALGLRTDWQPTTLVIPTGGLMLVIDPYPQPCPVNLSPQVVTLALEAMALRPAYNVGLMVPVATLALVPLSIPNWNVIPEATLSLAPEAPSTYQGLP